MTLNRRLSLSAVVFASVVVGSVARADDPIHIAQFDPHPDKADMLVVVAHPDDETTFGGLLSHYGYCRGKKIIFVSLTSGEWGNGMPHHTDASQKPDYSYDDSEVARFPKVPSDAVYPYFYREGELARALWMHGVRYRPITPRFKDMSGLQPWGEPEPAFALWGGRQKVVGLIVEQMRRFRPDVVVSMAANGFNGNPQHMAASRAAVLASTVAGDDRQFSGQLDELQPWQPAKVYLHVADNESYDVVHTHSWESDCHGIPSGARLLAARANALHESQEMKRECEPVTKFVLVETAVGPDKIGRDNLFENVFTEDVVQQ